MSRRVSIFGASFASGPAYQPETVTYMTAIGIAADGTATIYGITGLQLWEAVDVFMVGIKSDGITLADLFAYPIIGGTAARHALEMLRPTDIAWNGTFTASPAHVADGVEFQLASQNMLFPFGSAGFLPEFANTIGYYRNGGLLEGGNRFDLGSLISATERHLLCSAAGMNRIAMVQAYNNLQTGSATAPTPLSNMTGSVQAVDTSQTVRNEQLFGSHPVDGTQPSTQFNLGNPLFATLGTYAFTWFYRQAMTSAQMIQMQSRIHALQTSLNRQITY